MTSSKPRPPLIPGETRAYPVLPLRDISPEEVAALWKVATKSMDSADTTVVLCVGNGAGFLDLLIKTRDQERASAFAPAAHPAS